DEDLECVRDNLDEELLADLLAAELLGTTTPQRRRRRGCSTSWPPAPPWPGPRAGEALTPTGDSVVEALDEVAEPVALGAQVADVLGVGRRLHRHPFGDLEPEPLEAPVLDRVVGHELHGRDAQVDQD